MLRQSLLVAVSTLLVVAGASRAATILYSAVEIRSLKAPFKGPLQAVAINQNGNVLGMGNRQFVYYSASRVFRDVLAKSPPTDEATVFAFNDYNQVVGVLNSAAALWQSNGDVVHLPSPSGLSFATSINNARVITGSFGGGFAGSTGYDFTNKRSVAGTLGPINNNSFAIGGFGVDRFLYNAKTGSTTPLVLPTSGPSFEAPDLNALNNKNHIAGDFYQTRANPRQAFILDANTNAINLLPLLPGSTSAQLLAINDFDVAVGSNDQRAVVLPEWQAD